MSIASDILEPLLRKMAGTLAIQPPENLPLGNLPLAPGRPVSLTVVPPGARLSIVDTDLAARAVSLALNGGVAGNLAGTVVGNAVGTATGQMAGQLTDPLGTIVNNLQTELTGTTTEQATGSLTENLTGTLSGTLSGALPLPLELPVKLAVEWFLYRYRVVGPSSPSGERGPGGLAPGRRIVRRAAAVAGSAVDDIGRAAIEFEEVPLVADAEFVAPFGLEVPNLSFVFTAVREPTLRNPVRLIRVYVRATVTLSVTIGEETVSSGPHALPSISLLLPAIPVPTILLVASHRHFNLRDLKKNAVLVVVPGGVPIFDVTDLNAYLRLLRRTLSPLTSVRRFALLLLGVRKLSAALERSPRFAFRADDELRNLSEVTFYKNKNWFTPYIGWDNANDTEADDVVSSALLIGPPGRQVSLHTQRQLEGKRFVVTTGAEMVAAVPDLHVKEPQLEPAPILTPRAWVHGFNGPYGNKIRSLAFTNHPRPPDPEFEPHDPNEFPGPEDLDPDEPLDELPP